MLRFVRSVFLKALVAVILLCGASSIEACGDASSEPTAAGGSALGSTSTAGLDSPLLFDSQYYVSLYPELASAFGDDAVALRAHWLAHGIQEGRRASPVFDCDLYLSLYADMRKAFGSNCAAAMHHFADRGLPVEGRRGSIEFDAAYYLTTYAELTAEFGSRGYLAAGEHFVDRGLWTEGRRGSSEFDVAFYICHYPDLAAAFYGDYRSAVEHWTSRGLPVEGRRGSVAFDVKVYLSRYPDVQAAFGADYRAAMDHWLTLGIREGRSGNPNDGGGPDACPAGTAVNLQASFTTAEQGFPTAWYGFPLPPGDQGFAGLTGSVSLENSADLYSEVLFIVSYLPSGACPAGRWPDSTPEYGPPGSIGLVSLIVKAPAQGTYTVTVPPGFNLPGGLPMSNCLLVGLNGGTVTSAHKVTSTSHLILRYTASAPAEKRFGVGGEFCFGQNWGCQGATTDDARSFAKVTPVTEASRLVALYGDISDSTFDGTARFGALPAGAWTARNDFYVYHGAECGALGATGKVAGPGDFFGAIPADATLLMSVPLSGHGRGVSARAIYKPLSTLLNPGDCLVTLFGVEGGGGFDNETQISALVEPQ